MTRLVLIVLLTLGAVALDWYWRRDWKKSLLALGTVILLIAFAITGMTLRPILPLFLGHVVLLVVAWLGLLYYLWKGRFLWWIVLLPALTLLLFVVLNFLEGSRYEG